jgi:endonuclease YncB( thermonuclease family)
MPLGFRRTTLPALSAVVACALAAGFGAATAAPAGRSGRSAHEAVDGHGRVTYVADGDSPFVDHRDIRLIGIQAPEVRHHGHGRNWCHAIAAKKALSKLVYHRYVELRSMHSDSRNLGRPLRSIFVHKHGAWENVQADLLTAGKVLWFPQTVETEHNHDYHVLAAEAATEGIGVWNPTYCGVGPEQSAQLSLELRWDADGADEKNLNGEWVRVDNHGDTPVKLGGWHIRDTSLAMFTFPRHTVVPAHGGVTLHTGHGSNADTDRARNFHWDESHSLFGDVHRSRGEGDAAFLLDPKGDFRAWTDYPCVLACSDPLKGHIAMVVHYQNKHEYVRIHTINTDHKLWLSDYQLRSWPWTYLIHRGTYLMPGETLTVHWGHGKHPTRLRQFADHRVPMLKDTGGRIDLSTLRDIRIVCVSWGSGNCYYGY